MNNTTICNFTVTLLSKNGWYDSATVHADTMTAGLKKAKQIFNPLGFEVVDIITASTPDSFDLTFLNTQLSEYEEKNGTVTENIFFGLLNHDYTERIRDFKTYLYSAIRYQYGAY